MVKMEQDMELDYVNNASAVLEAQHVNPSFEDDDEEQYEPVAMQRQSQKIRETNTNGPTHSVQPAEQPSKHVRCTGVPPSLIIIIIVLCIVLAAAIAYLSYMTIEMGNLKKEVMAMKEISTKGSFGELNAQNNTSELALPLKGEKGDSGVAGIDGQPGEKGEIGGTGPKGASGVVGAKGNTGPKGEIGSKGDGQKGQKGIAGSSSSGSGGAVFTRWGRTSCLSSSTLLYYGVIGSSSRDATGGGVDFLCLHSDPEWLSTTTSATWATWMRSVEYESGSYGIFSSSIDDDRAVCAQCYTVTRPAILMIPGRITCPSGWYREYYGYLMAGEEGQAHPTSYICVYYSPTSYSHSNTNGGGHLHFVIADCSDEAGSIEECSSGEYVDGRPITCVLCSR